MRRIAESGRSANGRAHSPLTPGGPGEWAVSRGPSHAKTAKAIVARYPEGRQMSASIPLLDLAQRQVGAETGTQGWLPIPVMEFVAASSTCR